MKRSRNCIKMNMLMFFPSLTSLPLMASFFFFHLGFSFSHQIPHPTIKNACTTLLHPSLCFTALASVKTHDHFTAFHHLLEANINQTVESVESTRQSIKGLLKLQDLYLQERNALKDCLEMLDQTLYELGQAVDDLHGFRVSYGNLKTLLSAAMTNENTCIDGFFELEEFDSENQIGLKGHLQGLLTPISELMSDCLAMIRYQEQVLNEQKRLVTKKPKKRFPMWMLPGDRNLMQREPTMKADIVVAADGSGDYETIGEALKMAPNMSRTRFLIKIKAGVYNETVEISREKANIMLVGDGMNTTIITGSKSFADGFSTFATATLTVIGDRFLARDLTITNTAGSKKFQAVAARVTSNSAFYHCNFSSYQDTLYVHSLRQFYRDCIIEGTIDFIFGNAAAVFQNCTVIVRKPIPGQKLMITAQGRTDPNQNTGISLQNCTIVAAPDFNKTERQNFTTFLGRPWRNYSRTIVMKSYLGDMINPQGWSKWDDYSTVETVEYIEYLNFGPGSDTRHRVKWGGYKKNCSEEIARQFTVGLFLHGAGHWLKTTGIPLSYGS
ncbi:hypothetical protein ACE6H2_025029 [Prunus campanulata]